MNERKLLDQVATVLGAADFFSVRYNRRQDEQLHCRQGVVSPPEQFVDEGVMVTVHHQGGTGYGATSDLSNSGLQQAAAQALKWAKLSAQKSVTDFSKIVMSQARGEYKSPVQQTWNSVPRKDKLDRLRKLDEAMRQDARIVDASAGMWHAKKEQLYLTNQGGEIWQVLEQVVPFLNVTAAEGSEVQTRTFGGHAFCRQGGYEVFDAVDFDNHAARIRDEALALLSADHCPSDSRDLLLAPDQMILQIHESIGHPLETDRILGDERNYAGTSFVTEDMFGSYQYGSDLLNVTYDPTIPDQFASYGYDDEGMKAEKVFVIQNGILEKPLGATVSAHRSALPGLANARAERWNRPAIDRMANLNVEPGNASLQDMIAATERGVYMQTNCSWSIDDSRNKFQFGCEWGRLIEDGKLTKLVKNPNYRGISATFWRNLKMVGDSSTHQVMGTPFCGKGEPNQVITVGHASPACLFANVEVFGGA